MDAKCPVCGAPMDNGKCGYCNYQEKDQKTITVGSTSNLNDQPVMNRRIDSQENAVPVYDNTVSPKSRGIAFFLCLFFGIFGIHKFYVEKIGMGVVYFFTMGIFGIGWIWDIISIAIGSFKDKNGLPLK